MSTFSRTAGALVQQQPQKEQHFRSTAFCLTDQCLRSLAKPCVAAPANSSVCPLRLFIRTQKIRQRCTDKTSLHLANHSVAIIYRTDDQIPNSDDVKGQAETPPPPHLPHPSALPADQWR